MSFIIRIVSTTTTVYFVLVFLALTENAAPTFNLVEARGFSIRK
jgi:hypothetical protein